MNLIFSSYLNHHGVKGMKWGVRRYQNKDGSLTKEGKNRQVARNNIIRNREYTDDVNNIVSTLSNKEKKLLGASLNEKWIEKDFENQILQNKAKTFVTKIGNTPISFVEIWTDGGDIGQIAVATRNDKKYRGKGYASKDVDRAIKWVDRYGNKSIKELEWYAKKENIGSQKLAENAGFNKDTNFNNADFYRYVRGVMK